MTTTSRPLTLQDTSPVVFVDDSAVDRLLTKVVYGRSKLQNTFEFLESGSDFLQYMDEVKRGIRPMPALVLLDINMPGKDGFETLVELRADPAFKERPTVFIYTNSTSFEDEEKSFALGADGFQTKPVNPNDLIAFFNRFAPEPS